MASGGTLSAGTSTDPPPALVVSSRPLQAPHVLAQLREFVFI
jgi:hypothetical protein